MIFSKPRASTLLSFVIFVLITFIAIVFNILSIISAPSPRWYNFAVIALLTPIGLFVLYRIFIQYKVVSIGNNLIEVRFPLMRRHNKYTIKQVITWSEAVVKTGKNSVYKELEIHFHDKRKLKMGRQEYEEYDRVVQYLARKVPAKKIAAK